MDLNTVWFILIAILYIGYFVLEGFDFGVGILLPFLGKDDAQRRMILSTIGPHWNGNEVWLITAGGATFAAFPQWYATLFSGFYFPLFLILIALIVRGIAFEFRNLDSHPAWRRLWDWAIFGGSLVPALLWGVAFANFMRGVPIDGNMTYSGGFWNLLNGYALLGGIVSLLGFTLHGALYLSLKTSAETAEKARKLAFRLWIGACAALVAFTIYTYFETDILTKLGVNPGPVPIGALVVLFLAGYFIQRKRVGLAFVMMILGILFAVTTVFMELYPRVLISSSNPAWSLTIYNAASGSYTLNVMTVVALVFVPIVLVYQAWSYWTFRGRASEKETLEY